DAVDIAIYVPLRSILLDQATHESVPQNSGLVRPIRIVAERGSLANPTFPCATIARAAPGNIVADTLMAALRPICPDRIAAGMGNMTAGAYSGGVGGRHLVYIDTTQGAHGGARGQRRGPPLWTASTPTPATTPSRTARPTPRFESPATSCPPTKEAGAGGAAAWVRPATCSPRPIPTSAWKATGTDPRRRAHS